MFCEESLGKINARNVERFPEQVDPPILSLESVDYSVGTSEYFSARKKKKTFISITSMVGLTDRVLQTFIVCK